MTTDGATQTIEELMARLSWHTNYDVEVSVLSGMGFSAKITDPSFGLPVVYGFGIGKTVVEALQNAERHAENLRMAGYVPTAERNQPCLRCNNDGFLPESSHATGATCRCSYGRRARLAERAFQDRGQQTDGVTRASSRRSMAPRGRCRRTGPA